MMLRDMLIAVMQRTMAERYAPQTTDYSFFQWVEGKGMTVDSRYQAAASGDPFIDMRYNAFDWHQGVGFDALLEAEDVLGGEGLGSYAFVEEWLQGRIRDGLPKPSVNTTAPFLCMLRLFQRGGDVRYEAWCKQRALFLLGEAPRADKGAFEHTVIGIDARFESQMWADTMYMSGVFLARMYAHTGERAYGQEALRQALLHYAALRDAGNGLLYHAYECASRSHLSAIHWGRANGWGMLTCVDLLALLPQEWAGWHQLLAHLQAHAAALRKHQREDGGFGTALLDPDSAPETTVACAYAASVAKAIRYGWLDTAYVPSLEKSYAYIMEAIDDKGVVRQCSGGTPVMCSMQAYQQIPMVMSYYGQGLCLRALCEMAYLSRYKK